MKFKCPLRQLNKKLCYALFQLRMEKIRVEKVKNNESLEEEEKKE